MIELWSIYNQTMVKLQIVQWNNYITLRCNYDNYVTLRFVKFFLCVPYVKHSILSEIYCIFFKYA